MTKKRPKRAQEDPVGGMDRFRDESIFYGLILNEEQKEFRKALFNPAKNVIICNAVAGSGKTLLQVAAANILVKQGAYNGAVYMVSPVNEQKMGFLPGSLSDKQQPYMMPLVQALEKIGEHPAKAIEVDTDDPQEKLANKDAWIKATSHAFIRGINEENKFMILEEAQNWKKEELKRAISRCHDNSKIVIIGDISQTDIDKTSSAFMECTAYLKQFDFTQIVALNTSYRGRIATAIDRW